jgi:hypothetical protein
MHKILFVAGFVLLAGVFFPGFGNDRFYGALQYMRIDIYIEVAIFNSWNSSKSINASVMRRGSVS